MDNIEKFLFDIGGFMYPVDLNIDINIDCRGDVSTPHSPQSLGMLARALDVVTRTSRAFPHCRDVEIFLSMQNGNKSSRG
ncbi:hypothetical protein CHS0354_030445, partial [Potamilus streckersoni]